MCRFKKFLTSISLAVLMFTVNIVPAFAVNPDTGDHSNVLLAVGIGVVALVLVVAAIVLTGKKKKR